MKWHSYIFPILIFLFFFGMGMWLMYEELNMETEIVKCYDRWDNEIIGQECIDEKPDEPEAIMGFVLMSFVGAIFGIVLLMMEQTWEDYRRW